MILSYSFAYPIILYIGLIVIFCVSVFRYKYYKEVIYKFNFVDQISQHAGLNIFFYKFIPYILRLLFLVLLCLALARPQKPDQRTSLKVEGIDIMLVMDVSGSMQCFDDFKDKRSRFIVAQSEAVKFIEKRLNDAVGLIIFAKDIVTRCPLTFDKNMLSNITKEIELGQIDYSHTMISRALVAAISRLEHSDSKTKIIILLTDGEPSPEDISALIPIEMAQKLGIKIYTIGVGSQEGGYIDRPFFGPVACGTKLNIPLLQKISNSTGAKFFHAQSPKDLETIYDTIDKLEKSEIQAPIYTKYKDYFWPLLIFCFIILSIEIFANTVLLPKL